MHAQMPAERPADKAPPAVSDDEGMEDASLGSDAPAAARRKPRPAPESTQLSERVRPRGNRISIVGRQVRIVHGQRDGELGVISGLNGRYLVITVGAHTLDDHGPPSAPHAIINKTMECLELLPPTDDAGS
jgi:hypothetical protein